MHNKYSAKKTVVDGIVFDSKKEAQRYDCLKLMERCGQITELELQKRFEICPKNEWGRALFYVADFCFIQNGKQVVEDVKGVKTPVYKLKKRLLAEKYGIEIKET